MRRTDREITNTEDILKIVDKAKILHLGLFDKDFPYIVPLHFGYEYKNGEFLFYLHGAKEGHKLDLIRENPNACIELECDVQLISGGDIPCKYSSTYGAFIGRGKAEILTNPEERIKGLELLMKNQTGRIFYIDESMATAVEVIKVTVSDFSAKARQK